MLSIEKKKTSFIIFKGLSLKQIKQFFLEVGSPTLNLSYYEVKASVMQLMFNLF